MCEGYKNVCGAHYISDIDGVEIEVDTHRHTGAVFIRVRSDESSSDLLMLSDDQCDKLIEVLQNRRLK